MERQVNMIDYVENIQGRKHQNWKHCSFHDRRCKGSKNRRNTKGSF